MYVDDVVLLTKANTNLLKCINKILEDFTAFAGLEVTKNKSSVTFSNICEGNPVLQRILGFQIK